MHSSIPQFIYLVEVEFGNEKFVKIGVSNQSQLMKRINSLQIGCPVAYKSAVAYLVMNAAKYERLLHHVFRPFKSVGEWFRLSIEDVQTKLTEATAEESLMETIFPINLIEIDLGGRPCSRCKEWLTWENFAEDSTRRFGRDLVCRACRSKYHAKKKATKEMQATIFEDPKLKAALIEAGYTFLAGAEDGQ